MAVILDPWDPNNWEPDAFEFRVYLDAGLNRFALVDEADYAWAVQWRWNVKSCRSIKEYARRAVSTYYDPEPGQTRRPRKGSQSVYLHVEIMKRTGIAPPSPFHTLVDHRNGNSLDCRRANLRWATPSMNNRNIRGSHAHDLMEEIYA